METTIFPARKSVARGRESLVRQTSADHTGNTDLKFLEVFKSNFYQDLSLSEWLTHTPPELVMAHLNTDRAMLDAIPRDEVVVMPE